MKNSHSRQAFTLVEVLVAVAILGVLAALLLSSTRKTMDSAAAVKCANNLRMVGAGALAFIADNDGYLLPSKFWYNASWSSSPGFRDYVGVTNPTNSTVQSSGLWIDTAFTCPQLKKIDPARYPSFLNRGYSANLYAFRNDPEVLGEANEPAAPYAYPGRIINIANPSQTWMFTEGLRHVSGATSLSTYLKPSSVTGLSMPHQDYQNVVFFDGSVRRMNADDFAAMNGKKFFWGNR